MASRTKQKEEARARRLEEERQRSLKARRDRRIRSTLGIVLVAVVLVAVAIVVSTGGSKKSGLQKGDQKNATVTAVNNLLAGIPSRGTGSGTRTRRSR